MEFKESQGGPGFVRPILEPNEEAVLAALRNEADLEVDGLEPSLLSRLLSFFGGGKGDS